MCGWWYCSSKHFTCSKSKIETLKQDKRCVQCQQWSHKDVVHKVFVNFERVSKKFVEKMNPITGIIQVIDVHLRSPSFNIYLKDKSNNFWNSMHIMLLKVYCSSFSAVAVCMFDWWMVNLLQTQRRIVWLTAFAFKCDR